MAAIGVAVHPTAAERPGLIASGQPELQHDRPLLVNDAKSGAGVSTTGTLLMGTRKQSSADYDAVKNKLNSGALKLALPSGATIESIAALDSQPKGEGNGNAGKTIGNVNAIIKVNGEKLGVIIHCDLSRRSIEVLEANTNPRLTARLQRRAAAGSETCKKRHANKVAGNIHEFFKGKKLNKDGTTDVKATLQNLKKTKPSVAGRITTESLGPKGPAKKWPTVQIPPASQEKTESAAGKESNPASPEKAGSAAGKDSSPKSLPDKQAANPKTNEKGAAGKKAAGKETPKKSLIPGKTPTKQPVKEVSAKKAPVGKKTTARAPIKKNPVRKPQVKKAPARKAAPTKNRPSKAAPPNRASTGKRKK
ncbi:hypothetical protein BC829DRAFT_488432 [Chytridium lagenaria]|nr:hypothetical protein BC829DRAFT_488432 [Chytridium lagenaria]